MPPIWNQPVWPLYGTESKTAAPVFGSASAETSAIERRTQPLSVFHAGFEMYENSRSPAPLHAFSPR